MRFLRTLAINLALIGLIVYLLTHVANAWLNKYTRHGQSLALPNLKGVPIEEAIKLLESKKLRYVITDTVFFENMPKLAVVEQNPSPNSNVKEDRIIYLSINSNTAAMVMMPNLINSSLRYAETVLTGMGLQLGEVNYKPDIAQNAVLDQQYRGQSIQPNARIPKGSRIDLVVGDGSGGATVAMPNLTGLSYTDATNMLQQSLLTLGSVIFDGASKDTARAVVKRQNPPFSAGAVIQSGTQVDLFLEVK